MTKDVDQRLNKLERMAASPRLVNHYLQQTDSGWFYDHVRVADEDVERLAGILPVWVRPLNSWGTMFLLNGSTIGPDELERIVEAV